MRRKSEGWPDLRPAVRRHEGGFTLTEVLVATAIFAVIIVFVLSTFTQGMSTTGKSNERSAATTIGTQIMEQIRASVNPVEMVGFVSLPRTPLTDFEPGDPNCTADPPSPYCGITNPTPYEFELAVTVAPNLDLTVTTVTVDVFPVGAAQPLVTLTTILDDQ